MSGQVSVNVKREKYEKLSKIAEESGIRTEDALDHILTALLDSGLLQQLSYGSSVTGLSVDEMIVEGLDQYVQCNLSTLVEARASEAASA